MKNIKIFLLKIFIFFFFIFKNLCILHGHVFVMIVEEFNIANLEMLYLFLPIKHFVLVYHTLIDNL